MSGSSAGALASRAAKQLGLDAAGVAGTGPDGSTTLADVLREAGRSPPAAARPPPPRRVARADAGEEEGTRRIEVTCDAKAVRDACRALAVLAGEPPEPFAVVVRLCGSALRDFPGLSATAGEDGVGSRAGSIDVLAADSGPAVPVRGADGAGVRSIRDTLREDGSAPRPAATASPEAESGAGTAAAFIIRSPDAPDAPYVRSPDSEHGNDRRGGAVLTVTVQPDSIGLGLELDAASEGDGAAFLDRLRALCLDPRRALL